MVKPRCYSQIQIPFDSGATKMNFEIVELSKNVMAGIEF